MADLSKNGRDPSLGSILKMDNSGDNRRFWGVLERSGTVEKCGSSRIWKVNGSHPDGERTRRTQPQTRAEREISPDREVGWKTQGKVPK